MNVDSAVRPHAAKATTRRRAWAFERKRMNMSGEARKVHFYGRKRKASSFSLLSLALWALFRERVSLSHHILLSLYTALQLEFFTHSSPTVFPQLGSSSPLPPSGGVHLHGRLPCSIPRAHGMWQVSPLLAALPVVSTRMYLVPIQGHISGSSVTKPQ